MNIKTPSNTAVDRLKKVFNAIPLLVLATLSTPAFSALNTGPGGWVAGMVSSGSAPFDHLDPAAGDEFVRTHDSVTYRVGFTTVNGSDTNSRIVARAGSFTPPASYSGSALADIGFFDTVDMPTSCTNVSTTPVNDPPAAGVSGITADGQTIYCAQPSPTNGNNLDISYRIAGDAPNGTTTPALEFYYESDQTPLQSSPQTLTGRYGLEDLYGLADITIVAEPRWNLRVDYFRSGTYLPASGPNGEDGFVFSWSLGVMGLGSRKGLEALQPPYEFDVDFNDTDFPNAQIVDWDMQNTGYVSANFSATGTKAHHGCGNWYNQLSVSGNYFDNRHYKPNDRGTAGLGTVSEVADGGDCRLNTSSTASKTASLLTSGTDFSLTHWPSKHGRNTAAADTVNANNLDDSSNEWWVANKSILVWAPTSDITVNTTEFLTLNAEIIGTSATGQANTDPNNSDNSSSPGARRTISGSLSEIHSPPVWSNPLGLDYALRDPVITGGAHVNQIAPNQVFAARLGAYNNSTGTLPAGYICDKVDNTRLKIFDTRDALFTSSAANQKDPLTGVFVRYLAGPEFPVTWEYGVSSPWTEYNNVTSEYSRPLRTGSSQFDSGCADTDATWYSSIDSLVAAEGSHALQKVTHVRGNYDSYPAGSRLLIYIPQQANQTFAHSGSNLANGTNPGSTFSNGDSTSDSIAVHQAQWQTNEPQISNGGLLTSADAVRVFQTEYTRITKASSTHLPSGSLANAGDVVNYALTVNLSTSGSTHSSDVEVWDIIPSHLAYISGSTSFGGTPLADPACSDTSLPTEFFPVNGSTAAGEIADGYQACVWQLSNQQARKAAIGHESADLPTLSYKASLKFGSPSGTQILTSAFATSTDNLIPLPEYQGSGNGFSCKTGEACSFSNWLLNVQATPGIVLNKDVSNTTIPVDGEFDYTITYGAVGQGLTATRIIDVFPYPNDSRAPFSDYAGQLILVQAVAKPQENILLDTTSDDNFVALYTAQTASDIPTDPYDSRQTVDGTGTNSSTETNWCTELQFGLSNCPTDVTESTAALFLPDGANGAAANIPEGNAYKVELHFQTSGNSAGDIYSNSFTADSPSLTARRPSSNTVSTQVKAPDLMIEKSVTPDTAEIGTDVTFEISVTNNNSEDTSPIYADASTSIRLVDTLPDGLTLVGTTPNATGWDCAASSGNTIDCAYIGGLPLGTGAAVGSPIVFDATLGDAADNSWVKNKATVTLSGAVESDTSNNEDEAWVRALRPVDLTLAKTVSVSSAAQTEALQYSLSVQVEADGGRATGGPITVTDTLPSGISITNASNASGTDWDCSASTAPSEVSCSYTGSYPVAVGDQVGGDIVIDTLVDATATLGTLTNTATVALPGEEDTSNNSGTVPVEITAALAPVSGQVFIDSDTNGSADNADKPLNGVALTLCRVSEAPCSAANTVDSTTSDSDGNYQFDNVGLGNFFVVQSQPAGFGSSTDNIASITRTSSNAVEDINFGETLGTLSGFVYADMDQSGDRAATGENGVGEAIEVVLRGTTVDHVTGSDIAVEIRISADPTSGAYAIENIPAPKAGTSYSLAQEPNTVVNFTNATTSAGVLNTAGGASAQVGTADSANSRIDGISFTPAASAVQALTIDGQNYNFGEAPQAGISGRVYLDSDNNNTNNASDSGLEGVTIVLCRAIETPCTTANTVDTVETAPDGGYLFNAVPAGSYFVQQLQPASYGSATTNTLAITRTGMQAVANVDFVERAAVIAGQVFVDADKSGNRGPSDTLYTQGTAEVTLRGTTADGEALELMQTVDADGRYSFEELPAPNNAGYAIELKENTVTSPYYAATAHLGTLVHAGGSSGTEGTVSDLSFSGLSWSVTTDIATGNVATGLGYDFSVMTGTSVSGRVMRDTNANGSGNSTSDPEDTPQAGVAITLCRSENNPCPAADIEQTVQTDETGAYSFIDVLPGSYWAIEEQPSTLGNGPGATDSIAVVVGPTEVEDLDFLDRAGTLSGLVFSDKDANGVNDSEAGIEGITVTLTGTDADGNAVEISAITDANGHYQLTDIPAPDAAGYTLTESNEPANTRDGTGFVGSLNDAQGSDTGASGTVHSPDRITEIALVPGGTGDNYDFSELPATASVSGSVWRDRDSDRTYTGDEDAVPGWTVQLLHIDPVDGGITIVAEQVTGNDGTYDFTGQVPGDYQIIFRSPTKDANGEAVAWGTPVNGERGTPDANSNAEIADGIIRRITLKADVAIEQQSLPLDPSGVVYDSDKRTPVQGSTVELIGPAGFDPALHLLGGAAAVAQTTGNTGEYQFLLLANAPAGEYSLSVEPPAGYTYASTAIPAEPGTLTPPIGPADLFHVVPSELAPVQGAPTTYYTSFNLTPGVSSGVVHNHIPLDPQVAPVLFVTKQADRSTAELGDSIKYTVRMHNRGTANAPALAIEDVLPLGFKYINGTAKLTLTGEDASALDDPSGSPGPSLLFSLPGELAAGEALEISYRVRAGVGSDHGDGINRATGITGALRSATAEARVSVSGGVLGDEACLTGRVFVDCNHDHVQNGEELGIPGVRLYMEDGRYLVSDVEGKYSSCDLTPQTHILKVDRMTLPRGSRLTTSSNRNIGDANSLFIDMKAGEMHRADFIEGSCTSMVLEQVRARRSTGEVLQSHIEAMGAASLSQRSHAQGINRGTVSADQSLVRDRPAQNTTGTLAHSQDLPASEQNIQAGSPFFLGTEEASNDVLSWHDQDFVAIALQLSTDTAPADGLNAIRVQVDLTDDNGQRLKGRQLVTLVADGGHLWLPGQDTHEHNVRAGDLDPSTPGIQAWAQDGRLQASLLAPDQPKRVLLSATAGGLQSSHKIEFTPALREWIAAGLVEGIVRLNDKGGLSAVNADGLFERELQEWQRSFNGDKGSAALRAAFFVKGAIKGKYLLTASYDSEKEDSARILQDIQPEQLYPVFGDASVKGFEAQSSSKLFVRISRDKHYLLYGDFQSDNGTADLGANNRTLTGARLHLDGEKGLLDVYAANDSLRQQVEELTPNGTSGPYGIKGLAVENTERVELIIRDRNLRTRILERRQLTRLVDYSFDAYTGRLLFKEPVSRTDGDGNTQTIRISYEQDGDGDSSLSGGVRAEAQLADWARLGGSYSYNELDAITDDQLSELASVDLTVAITEWLKLQAEVAQSTTLAADGSGETRGDAARIQVTAGSEMGSWQAVLHAVQSDEDFHNSNASVDSGRGEVGLHLQAAISDTFSLQSDIQRSTDKSTDAEVDSAYLGLKLRPTDGFAVSAGMRHLQDNGRGLLNSSDIESNGSVYTGSGLSNAGAGLFSSGETIASTVDANPLETTTLLLGADWSVTEKLSLGAELEDSFDGDESWRATAKAGWQLNDKQTLQARYETQTGLGTDVDRRQKSRAFVFGLTRNFDEDGSNFTELRLRDSIGGREAHLAYGIRNGFALGSGFRGMASAEQVAILDGDGRTATSGALGVSHTGGERWKGSARVEGRRLHDNQATAEDDSADSWLANISIARKLDSSWTALAKYIALGSDDKSQDGDQRQQRIQVGAAYRPVDNNRLAVVSKLEHRRERNSELSTPESRDLWVASVNSNWHPTRAWWLGARLAAKDVDESLEGVQDDYQASLVGARATYDITERMDVGVMGNYRYSPDGHTQDWAAGVEAGYAVQTNLWLSLGYNWGGFSDKDLTGNNYTQRGWFIRLRYKFDEDLFNGASETANRSLPRSTNQQEEKS